MSTSCATKLTWTCSCSSCRISIPWKAIPNSIPKIPISTLIAHTNTYRRTAGSVSYSCCKPSVWTSLQMAWVWWNRQPLCWLFGNWWATAGISPTKKYNTYICSTSLGSTIKKYEATNNCIQNNEIDLLSCGQQTHSSLTPAAVVNETLILNNYVDLACLVAISGRHTNTTKTFTLQPEHNESIFYCFYRCNVKIIHMQFCKCCCHRRHCYTWHSIGWLITHRGLPYS